MQFLPCSLEGPGPRSFLRHFLTPIILGVGLVRFRHDLSSEVAFNQAPVQTPPRTPREPMPKPSIKARELSCLSLDVIVLAPFNPAFSSLSPTGSSGSSRVLAESPSGEPRLYALYNNLLFINLASFDP